MADRVDVAIVGGGAAGIAAARRLAEAHRSVLLIEALPRLGGRAHTVTIQDMRLDLGCGWLHSAERNPLAALAGEKGLVLDRSEGAWRKPFVDTNGVTLPHQDQSEAFAAYEAFRRRLHEGPPASDCAGDVVPRGDRWRPFLDALSSFINGAELDRLSIADFLAYDDAASDQNWRLHGGYGAFIAGLGADIPVMLDTKVTRISHGDGVTLDTNRGTLHARAAIVAVSSAVLARGDIAFAPSLDDHLHAAAQLPLGLADKIFLSVADPEAVPAESHLLGRLDAARTGSYYLRPFGRPVIECFLGGDLASTVEEKGEGAAIAFAIGELRGLLGADFARGLAPIAVTGWAHEPTILGSYSHALPGHAVARRDLASPVSEHLCFAGEACSTSDYSTAHGAWESGLAAADWIARGLDAVGSPA
jgi:monoamine oxidase